jgi:outer membrane protein assembly factor BamB
LVLNKPGVMLAVGDTLVVGFSGRLVGLHPLNGTVRWEAPVASPRGTNDVERLVDLVGPVARTGDVVCVRAFQASVGCVNAARGSVLWTKPASGAEGVGFDDKAIYGTELDSKLVAWSRRDGARLWDNDDYKFRSLTAPLATSKGLVVGDGAGILHWVSSQDGSTLQRTSPDGSAVATAPIAAGPLIVAVTQNGTVAAYRAE